MRSLSTSSRSSSSSGVSDGSWPSCRTAATSACAGFGLGVGVAEAFRHLVELVLQAFDLGVQLRDVLPAAIRGRPRQQPFGFGTGLAANRVHGRGARLLDGRLGLRSRLLDRLSRLGDRGFRSGTCLGRLGFEGLRRRRRLGGPHLEVAQRPLGFLQRILRRCRAGRRCGSGRLRLSDRGIGLSGGGLSSFQRCLLLEELLFPCLGSAVGFGHLGFERREAFASIGSCLIHLGFGGLLQGDAVGLDLPFGGAGPCFGGGDGGLGTVGPRALEDEFGLRSLGGLAHGDFALLRGLTHGGFSGVEGCLQIGLGGGAHGDLGVEFGDAALECALFVGCGLHLSRGASRMLLAPMPPARAPR